jgi:hypothetical protein
MVIAASPKTLTEAIEVARKAEALLANKQTNINTVEIAKNGASRAIEHKSRRDSSVSSNDGKKHSNRDDKTRHIRERSDTPSRKSSNHDVTCYRCNEIGHISVNCRNKGTGTYSNRASNGSSSYSNGSTIRTKRPLCYNCNKPGHLSRDCWQERKN